MRKRVNLTLTPQEYDRLHGMTQAAGLRSVSQTAAVAVRWVLRCADCGEVVGRAEAAGPPQTPGEEIHEMFAGLADSEPTPFNTPVPARR